MKCSALVATVLACSVLAGCKQKPAEDARAGAPAQAEAGYRPPTECDLRAQSYAESECFANLSGFDPADEGLKTAIMADINRGMYERSSHTDASGRCWWDTTVELDYQGRHLRHTVSCPVPDSVKVQ